MVALQTGEEGRHRLICGTGLHLVEVATSLTFALHTVDGDRRGGRLGVEGLILLSGRLDELNPTTGVLLDRRGIGELNRGHRL